MSTSELHLVSLGAGVQSSTMALMAAVGEITPMPRAAIFADTGAEPASVYRWLDWLEKQLPFPVFRVMQHNGLETGSLRVRQRKDGKGSWVPSGIPHYSVNRDGSFGHGPRQCTQDFKMAPLRRQAKKLMRLEGYKIAVQWIGISLDEAHRMKPSKVRWLVCQWPLIELRMKRNDCLRWMEKMGYPHPPRSACVFCPYHSDREWRRLRDEEPEEFQRAVRFERQYQEAKALTVSKKGFVPYLHDSRVPLDQVDFSTDEDQGQQLLFGNECQGLCGV
jgi:hypothetical protein